MGEKDQTNIRLDEEDKRAINELVDLGEYESMSAFVRQAIKEKLNPTMRRARNKRELRELLRDPEIRRELGLPEL